VPAIGDQHPVQALPPDRANETLGDRIRLRRPDRRAEDPDPLSVEDRVERARELPIVITDQELHRPVTLGKRENEVPRLLRRPRTIRTLAQTGKMHPPAGKLDEKQHIDPPQHDRVDREEVARDQAPCLAANELTPRHPTAPASRPDPSSDQDVADTRRRDLGPKPSQLARDPPVPPPRVLPSQPQDQLSNVTVHPWPTGTPSRICPAASHKSPMPREQRRRSHEEHPPALSGQQPARRRQEHPVRRPVSPAATPADATPRPHAAEQRSQAPWTPTSENTATRAPSNAQRAHKTTTPKPALPQSTEPATVRPRTPKHPHQQARSSLCTPQARIPQERWVHAAIA
jgi:hypothetical protein